MDCKVKELLDPTMTNALKTKIQTILSTLLWDSFYFATKKLLE